MNDFLIDRCGHGKQHPPHKYGRLMPNDVGTMSIRHPLYCDGQPPEQPED